jgi:hypothetical protein
VWVFERCGLADDGCAKDKTLDPVLEFDTTGKLVRSWGKGDILYPHGIFVSHDRHIWLVEGISQSNVVSNVIHEYTADGKLLRTMGTRGTSGATNDLYNGVSDVLVAPDGSIFVADGHSDKTNNRILKYDRNGKFLLSWGKLGQVRANSILRTAWRWTRKGGSMSPTVPTAASRFSTSRASSWRSGGSSAGPAASSSRATCFMSRIRCPARRTIPASKTVSAGVISATAR